MILLYDDATKETFNACCFTAEGLGKVMAMDQAPDLDLPPKEK